jgi:hypothetical protein
MNTLMDLKFKNLMTCPECSTGFEFTDLYFENYFNLKTEFCPNCKKMLNFWDMVKKQLELDVFGWHYGLLGCEGRIIYIFLTPGKIYELDLLKEIGEGRLLYITYTPQTAGGLFPIQMHSNTPVTHIMFPKIHLYPMPTKENPKETEVAIYYWFSPKDISDDLSNMLLVDSFQRFYEGNYRYMVISAQTAIEILQYRFLEGILKSAKLSNKRIKQFLVHDVVFSTQLSTLLPLLANLMKFPTLDDQILEGLHILVNRRNDVLHRGVPKTPWDKKEMINALAGAFLTFKYLKTLHKVK